MKFFFLKCAHEMFSFFKVQIIIVMLSVDEISADGFSLGVTIF